ncbi:hypothetical protein HYT58_02080 [Candidatus Woesearchaeota archaeon]|nr:hypothetical protein [Candidatus Woesearchaeota archaeon]
MRNHEWLETRFNQIWNLFFPEVERKMVFIRWKGFWKNKFGHIRKTGHGTEIAINRLFQDERVPEDVIKLTIAHEIIHYMHGFHSHLPKQFNHPHAHGVVNKELISRGFKYAIKNEKLWVKNNWFALYKELRKTPVKEFHRY